ncbi:protein PAXX isoform X2 [Rhinolophus ferrumequinum]|uniref:protein PAXX isoform X2 n=1 Tax=Rhinolophus ferrumequinum TaxID=59479 RepID=UPI00140FA052|nr:protein PAXX isoform X2 [Rhinolophus ferrumequinum]
MVPVPVPPPLLSPPLCTLPPGTGPARFVCYCEGEGVGAKGQGGFNIYVTDAAELWSTCFTPESLAALKARFGLSAAEDITRRFRTACEQQAVAFTLQEDGASLTVSGGPLALDLNLSKVPGPEAAPRLQALTLGLAERVCSLERRLTEETAASPRKSSRLVGPQQFLPDPDPQRGIPGPGVRRRCPGESLINPGFKRSQPAVWILMISDVQQKMILLGAGTRRGAAPETSQRPPACPAVQRQQTLSSLPIK